MKISHKVEWLIPYFKLAKGRVKNLKKVKEITSALPPLTRTHSEAACLRQDNEDGTYTIHIYLADQDIKFKNKKINSVGFIHYSQIDILTCLAHELAHLDYVHISEKAWTHHHIDRQILQTDLEKIFWKLLKKQGYVSEEYELAEFRKKAKKMKKNH